MSRNAAPVVSIPAVLLASMFLVCSAQSQDFKPSWQLSLDTRYLRPEYSNTGIARFGVELLRAASFPGYMLFRADSHPAGGGRKFLMYDSQELRYLGEGFSSLALTFYLDVGFSHAFHEFGHGTRLAAIGATPLYYHSWPLGAEPILHSDFFSYWFSTFRNWGGGGSATTEEGLRGDAIPKYSPEWGAVVQMGGVNNESYFGELLEDDIYRRNGDFTLLLPYKTAKTAASEYGVSPRIYLSEGDMDRTRVYYERRGFPIRWNDIATGSERAFWLSGLTYQMYYTFGRWLLGRTPRFRGWEPFGIQLPNTTFYLNKEGLSYKVRSAYRRGPWRLPFAVEYLYKGDKRSELTLGGERSLSRGGVRGNVIVGHTWEMNLEGDLRVSRYTQFTAGFTTFDVRNLNGERLSPDRTRGTRCYQLFLMGSLVY